MHTISTSTLFFRLRSFDFVVPMEGGVVGKFWFPTFGILKIQNEKKWIFYSWKFEKSKREIR